MSEIEISFVSRATIKLTELDQALETVRKSLWTSQHRRDAIVECLLDDRVRLKEQIEKYLSK